MASQNGIQDFHNTGKKVITLSNGKKVDLNLFKGDIAGDSGNANIKGMVASWLDSGSTIMVFGVLSDGDLIIKHVSGKDVTVKIDSEKEVNEMEQLIRNVK